MFIDDIFLSLAGIIVVFLYSKFFTEKDEPIKKNISLNKKILIIFLLLHAIAIAIHAYFSYPLSRITKMEEVRMLIIIPLRATIEFFPICVYLFWYKKYQFRSFYKIKNKQSAVVGIYIYALIMGTFLYFEKITREVRKPSLIILVLFLYQTSIIQECYYRWLVFKLFEKHKARIKVAISAFIGTVFVLGQYLLLDRIDLNFNKILFASIYILINQTMIALSYYKTKQLSVAIIANFIMNYLSYVLLMIV